MDNAEIRKQLQSKIDQILNNESPVCEPKTRMRGFRESSDALLEEPSNIDREAERDKFDDPDEAFKRLLRLVDARERSEYQLKEKLSQKGFTRPAIDAAIARAISANIVNDDRFADMLIASRVAQGKGFTGIERELKQNNIDPDTIPGWPYDYGFDESIEINRALEMLERKPPHCKNLRDGAYRKLVSKGFSPSVCSKASGIWFDRQREND